MWVDSAVNDPLNECVFISWGRTRQNSKSGPQLIEFSLTKLENISKNTFKVIFSLDKVKRKRIKYLY